MSKTKIAGLLAFLSLALPVGAFVAVASVAPAEFAGDAEVALSLPPDQVWARIGDVERHPVSAKVTKRVTRLPDENGLPVWTEDLGSTAITVRVVERAPDREVRVFTDAEVPLTATWTITTSAVDGGTLVRVEQEGVIEDGPFYVPFFRAVMWMGGARSGPSRWAKALRFE